MFHFQKTFLTYNHKFYSFSNHITLKKQNARHQTLLPFCPESEHYHQNENFGPQHSTKLIDVTHVSDFDFMRKQKFFAFMTSDTSSIWTTFRYERVKSEASKFIAIFSDSEYYQRNGIFDPQYSAKLIDVTCVLASDFMWKQMFFEFMTLDTSSIWKSGCGSNRTCMCGCGMPKSFLFGSKTLFSVIIVVVGRSWLGEYSARMIVVRFLTQGQNAVNEHLTPFYLNISTDLSHRLCLRISHWVMPHWCESAQFE